MIVSLPVTIAAQDLIKISENTKAALARKKAAGVQLGAPSKKNNLIAPDTTPQSEWCLELGYRSHA